MLKLKKIDNFSAKEIDLKELFPDITEEIENKINFDLLLKKDIIDYVNKDRAGTQFNAVRICFIPEDPEPLEREVESLEYDLELMDEEDKRRPRLKKEIYLKRKEIEKLKHPYRYFDNICECYEACPLYRKGLAPINEQCYFEMQKVAQATEGYINEFSIDLMTNNVAKEQITQIVLCDLLIYRASKALAVTNLSSISEKVGELGVEYTRQRNHLIGLITEQNKTRNKLLETMLGTPEIRKKYKIDNVKNAKQTEAEKATAALIESKESIKKHKVPNLINRNIGVAEEDNNVFKIEDIEVIE